MDKALKLSKQAFDCSRLWLKTRFQVICAVGRGSGIVVLRNAYGEDAGPSFALASAPLIGASGARNSVGSD